MDSGITSRTVVVDGLKLHYLEAGPGARPGASRTADAARDMGEPVLLLHGWPTSSYLWRNIMPAIARTHRVLALDLPGFGASDKPLDVTYNFEFHCRMIDGFLQAVGADRVALGVHDLGGPIGLYWAVQRPERLAKLALLNTLVYPQPSWAVIAFVLASRVPLLRSLLVSPRGLEWAMRLGIRDRARHDPEMLAAVLRPFTDASARKALLKNAHELNGGGFFRIQKKLSSLKVPVRIVYGEADGILPDVARTMARVQRDLPQAQVTKLPGCGHFLQEDRPHEVAALLAGFFSTSG